MRNDEDIRLTRLTREFALDRSKIDESKREIELSFSSEAPVERWFGKEVLDHSPDSLDLSRLNGGSAPLLWNHDTDQLIGAVRKAWTANGKARAVVRFGNSTRAKEVWQDVEEGIIQTVSVGYRVNRMESEGIDGGVETMRVTDWMPYEISMVSVPADPSVGIGRSAEQRKNHFMIEENNNRAERRAELGQEYERKQEIKALADQFGQNDPELERAAGRAILTGMPVSEFRQLILTTKFQARPIQTSPDVGMDRNETKRWSLVRALNRLANKQPVDGLEKEVNERMARMTGNETAGVFIPNEVVHGHPEDRMRATEMLAMALLKRDLSAGTPNAGGYTIQTDVFGSSLIELLRNMTVCFELGARKLGGLQGNVAIPSQSGAATSFWLAENAQTTASNQTFGQIGLTPHRLSAVTVLGKMLLAQSSVDVEGLVREDLARVLAVSIDLAGLAGTGAAGQPLGILSTSGIGAVTFGGAATFAKVIDFETQVANSNALAGSLAYVTTPNVRAKLRVLPKIGSTFPEFVWERGGRLLDYPAVATKQIASDKMIYGNFNDLIIADWIGMDVVVDPYSLADKHQVKVTINMLADVAVRHAGSFCASTDSAAQ